MNRLKLLAMFKRSKNTVPWIEANQAYLAAEFVRLRNRLGSSADDSAAGAAQKARASMDSPPAIERLTDLFGLSEFEKDILLLCAGIEMDSKLATQCCEVEGRQQRPYATFGVALSALPAAHWSALTPLRPLRAYRLLEMESGYSFTSAPLKIDERILHYLAGVNFLDSRLQPVMKLSSATAAVAQEHRQTAEEAAQVLNNSALAAPAMHLCGDDDNGQEDTAALIAQKVGRQLFVAQGETLPAVGPELDQLAVLWSRESLLIPAALLIQCGSSGLSGAARYLAERLDGLIFLASREPLRLNRAFVRLEVNKPQPIEQRRLWQQALGESASKLGETLDDLAEQFRLSARMILATSALAASAAKEVRREELWSACRSLARPKLEDLAQRIVPAAGWDDLVLPEAQRNTLRQLAAQVRYRMKVYETWGFSAKGRRGLGVSALFTGESGTGKTLAAEVVARELSLDVYRIDLSAVVSKYIGETEKNLKQVFDAAEEGGVLLLFDEADALFGKRGEVKDSHDRYANIEVGYLLQRMEAYQGLAILTTNLKASMDRAFQRRLRFTLHFPFPDAAQRQLIWSKVFPSGTPTHGLDVKRLAQLNVTGGSIRNIALNAAFLAVQTDSPVEMRHLVDAARLEAQKIERPLSEAEVRGWVA
jgi:hypothetical protein